VGGENMARWRTIRRLDIKMALFGWAFARR
jgi:hypothetical protein